MTGNQLTAVALIAAGEALAISAEFLAYRSGMLRANRARWARFAGLWAVSGVLLVGGYAAGTRAFGGVWPVFAASVASILIVEPPVIAAVTRTRPGRREAVCFGLGLAGLSATVAL